VDLCEVAKVGGERFGSRRALGGSLRAAATVSGGGGKSGMMWLVL
jgi:hypothetical protein